MGIRLSTDRAGCLSLPALNYPKMSCGSDLKAWRHPAIRRLHIRHGPNFHLPINEALPKGDPIDIGFLLSLIQDRGVELP